MNIKEKIKRLNNLINSGDNSGMRLAEDLYGLEIISSLLQRGPFLPLSATALRPYSLAFLMNELVINNRKKIIEFGAGISTLLLGRLIRDNGLQAKIYSIDEDEKWAEYLNARIVGEQLSSIVEISYSPLGKRSKGDGEPHWYDEKIAGEFLKDNKFDMVLVDGPTAFNKSIALSRYFAFPFIKDRLSEDFVFFLDDANRQGEQEVLNAWTSEFQIDFKIFAGTLAVAYKGRHYQANPLI